MSRIAARLLGGASTSPNRRSRRGDSVVVAGSRGSSRRRAAPAAPASPSTSTIPTATTTWPTSSKPAPPPPPLLPPGFVVPPLFSAEEEEEALLRERRRRSLSSSSSTAPPPLSFLPRHVAIILDGNTRWARRRGLPARFGHAAGARALAQAVACFTEWGVEALTVFAFSTENWKRPKSEISAVLAVVRRAAREHAPSLRENGVRLRFVGDKSGLPRSLVEACEAAEEATRGGGGGGEDGDDEKTLLLTVALGYGARADAARAARALAAAAARGEVDPRDIDERAFERALSTASNGESDDPRLSDVDLLIRTAGERRLSNFLLYESAYAELVFLDECWPDVGPWELRGAVREFCSRPERRFGGKNSL